MFEYTLEKVSFVVFYKHKDDPKFLEFLKDSTSSIARIYLIEYHILKEEYDDALLPIYCGIKEDCPYCSAALAELYCKGDGVCRSYSLAEKYAAYAASKDEVYGHCVLFKWRNKFLHDVSVKPYMLVCSTDNPRLLAWLSYNLEGNELLECCFKWLKIDLSNSTLIYNMSDAFTDDTADKILEFVFENTDLFGNSHIKSVMHKCKDYDLSKYYDQMINLDLRNNMEAFRMYVARDEILSIIQKEHQELQAYRYHPDGKIAKELEESFNTKSKKLDSL